MSHATSIQFQQDPHMRAIRRDAVTPHGQPLGSKSCHGSSRIFFECGYRHQLLQFRDCRVWPTDKKL